MSNNTTANPVELELHAYMKNVDQFFAVFSGILVILMSMGWAFLEAGAVRSKNSTNVLLKNIVDTFVAGVAYWIFGFAFAYGDGNKFIGYHWFASSGLPYDKFAFFFFQYVFASTSATIVAGAIAERCDFYAYFIYCFIITAVVYPVVTHWIWYYDGWLSQGAEYLIGNETMRIGFTDFSGSGCVHLVGGTAGLVGCIIIGPRIGIWHPETGKKIDIKGHSTPLVALGGFILFFGFLAFNSASALTLQTEKALYYVAISGVNTFLSGSTCALTAIFLSKSTWFGNGTWSMVATVEGGVTGMVVICAGCNQFYPWGAAIAGVVAACLFRAVNALVKKLKIDDPTEVVAMHFQGGSWGLISVAFFDKDVGILLHWNRAAGIKLAWQLAGWACIVAWTAGMAAATFGIMDLLGILRVTPEVELKGLDVPEHGEPAYPVESYVQVEQIKTENGQVLQISHSVPNLLTVVGSSGDDLSTQLGMFNARGPENPNSLSLSRSFGNLTESPSIGHINKAYASSEAGMESPVILRIGFETPELIKKSERKLGRFSKKDKKPAEDTRF